MKARKTPNQQMVDTLYEEGFVDGTKANFATILYILSRDYGFGKKRLLNMKKKSRK